ncbi:MAG: leucyl aminopeptidase family protein [Alphaproteobacteria bacterium]|nr:leucyl aminopeptidase family protein [Alphaproteobacteria bacterium]
MSTDPFDLPAVFLDKPRKGDIPLRPLTSAGFADWLKKQPTAVKNALAESGFSAAPGKCHVVRSADGSAAEIIVGVSPSLAPGDFAAAAGWIKSAFSPASLKKMSFSVSALKKADVDNACLGWALASYGFSLKAGKPEQKIQPGLVWPKGADKVRVLALQGAISLVRNMVNMPANLMGPDEIEGAARRVGETFGTKISIIHDEQLLKKNFPLIHTVGMASPRRPRLIDLSWGRVKDPKITLVGKGVAFDTGGLNLKPGDSMKLMKKDMGGAAHVLGLAWLIMSLKLPVRLRVLIPAVENSVAGNAFRPGDVIKSRKGLSVENTNTDAEGRLILADALSYACEDSPALLVDFATLTGSARVALGPDIPPVFSNREDLAGRLKRASDKAGDPVWPMPLWQPYRKMIESPVADLVNSVGAPGDLIYSALFLESFVEDTVPWIHLDVFAWENSGRPGRPKGAADTGLLAVFALIEDMYGTK